MCKVGFVWGVIFESQGLPSIFESYYSQVNRKYWFVFGFVLTKIEIWIVDVAIISMFSPIERTCFNLNLREFCHWKVNELELITGEFALAVNYVYCSTLFCVPQVWEELRWVRAKRFSKIEIALMLMDNLYQFILSRFFSETEIAFVFPENKTSLQYSFFLRQIFKCIHNHPIFHFHYGIHYQMLLLSSSNIPQVVQIYHSSYVWGRRRSREKLIFVFRTHHRKD